MWNAPWVPRTYKTNDNKYTEITSGKEFKK
jgi:hypothetical protein